MIYGGMAAAETPRRGVQRGEPLHRQDAHPVAGGRSVPARRGAGHHGAVRFRKDLAAERGERPRATNQRLHHHRRRAPHQTAQATPLLRAAGRYLLRQPHPQADAHVHSPAQTAREHDPPGEDEPRGPHTTASGPQALPRHNYWRGDESGSVWRREKKNQHSL